MVKPKFIEKIHLNKSGVCLTTYEWFDYKEKIKYKIAKCTKRGDANF